MDSQSERLTEGFGEEGNGKLHRPGKLDLQPIIICQK
jgi:hypothetical protein